MFCQLGICSSKVTNFGECDSSLAHGSAIKQPNMSRTRTRVTSNAMPCLSTFTVDSLPRSLLYSPGGSHVTVPVPEYKSCCTLNNYVILIYIVLLCCGKQADAKRNQDCQDWPSCRKGGWTPRFGQFTVLFLCLLSGNMSDMSSFCNCNFSSCGPPVKRL